MKKQEHILSIDVEDWFHILELDSTPQLERWKTMESRIEKNFYYLLNILDEKNIKATCFFLGWIAERFPALVKQAAQRGHEIASHGYAHQLIFTQTESEFYDDISKTKMILEDVAGKEVKGYRAPGFSITPQTPWAFAQLEKAGYIYDSSLFPAKRGHGYFLDTKLHPHKIQNSEFYEFPITVANFMSKRVCFFGGGYLRLFPYFLINKKIAQVSQESRPVIFYIHPREIDINQPRLKMGFKRRFKSYINLKTTEKKLRRIIGQYDFVTCSEFIKKIN